MPQGFQITGQVIDGIEKSRVINQPMRQIGDRSRVRNIVALNEVAEQHCIEIFLVDYYSQHPVEACNLRKPVGFTVFFKYFLDNQAFLAE